MTERRVRMIRHSLIAGAPLLGESGTVTLLDDGVKARHDKMVGLVERMLKLHGDSLRLTAHSLRPTDTGLQIGGKGSERARADAGVAQAVARDG